MIFVCFQAIESGNSYRKLRVLIDILNRSVTRNGFYKEKKKVRNGKILRWGENDVVPQGWLCLDDNQNTRCRWPGKNFDGNIETIVKNQLQPQPSRKTYKCEILCQSG